MPVQSRRGRPIHPALLAVIAGALLFAQAPRTYHLGSTPETVYRGFFPRNAKPALTVPSGAIVEIDTLSHQGLNSFKNCTPAKGDLSPGQCVASGELDPVAFQAQYGIGAAEVLPALVDTMRRYQMPGRYLHDLISGAEMDLTIRAYPSFERLKEYCYRVAGTVGLTCTHIFGFRDPKALDLAEKLGLAFQLTNIIRDVKEDYLLGRVYLPEEDLQRYGVAPENFGRNEATLGACQLLNFEAERAWQLYEDGSRLLELIDEDSRATLWLLVNVYSSLLARMESLDFAVFGERVRLSKAEKMILIAKARFGRHTEENILAKRDRDRRRTGGAVGERRAG